MTLNELLYISTVAEEKSISKAAERLYIAQPSLSQAISKIEKRYDCQFFDRTIKGLRLTEAGEIYLKSAYAIIQMNRQMELDLCGPNAKIKNKIIIGTLYNHGSYFLPQTFIRFKKQYPGIDIEIMENNPKELEEALLTGIIDIAVTRLPTTDSNIKTTALGSERFILMANKNHPLIEKRYAVEGYDIPFIDLRLFSEESFILFPQSNHIRILTDMIFKKAGFSPKKVMEVRSLSLHEELCASCSSVSISPKPLFNLIGNNKDVFYFNIEDQYCVPYTLIVATVKTIHLSKPVKDFIELIKKYNEFLLRSQNPQTETI